MCLFIFVVTDAVRTSCPQILHFYLERLATPRLLGRQEGVFDNISEVIMYGSGPVKVDLHGA